MTLIRRTAIAGICLLIVTASAHASTLVAQWLFVNFSNLGIDSSGNNNNLTTTVGTPTGTTSGPNAGADAVILNGASSLQRLTGLNNFSGTGGYSYSAWVDLSTGGASGFSGILSQDLGSCCVNRFMIANSLNPFINVGQHNDQQLAGTVPANGNWFLYTITAQTVGATTVVHVYVNGVDVTGSPLTEPYNLPSLATDRTYLGTGESGSTHFMNGKLADVRIYDGALTGAQVLGLFQAGAAGPNSIPEPATMTLLGAGLFAVGIFVRKRAS